MKTLYIDCGNGVSGDMLRDALEQLAEIKEQNRGEPERSKAGEANSDDCHCEMEAHEHHIHRSYEDVKKLISDAVAYTPEARRVALNIYEVIARAEAKVHEKTLATVHFHEVGRDEAIENALRIGAALDKLGFTNAAHIENVELKTGGGIFVGEVYDGKGFVDCAHGRIPVPVPAVRAMMDECGARELDTDGCGKLYPDFEFEIRKDVDTEMVTPSGLAGIIGIGAKPLPRGSVFGESILEGRIVAEAEAKGGRDTGAGGLKAYLIE